MHASNSEKDSSRFDIAMILVSDFIAMTRPKGAEHMMIYSKFLFLVEGVLALSLLSFLKSLSKNRFCSTEK
jgi:hypothetical protein